MTPETQSGRRVTWPAIIALALIPLLTVAALIGLTRPDAERIDAAVVNLDEAVTVDGQLIPMGRQLAAAMLERDGENVSWTLADVPGAAAGLRSGEFAAVVTIPEGFSAAATSFSANDAAQAQQATIDVEVSDNAPVTDAQLAQQVARLATETINDTLTEGYLDGIYVGFNTVGEQFTTIVDGARQLADGSGQLADGTLEASQGANQLADGMTLLADNGPRLADGGDQLVLGVGELGDGAAQLADGAGQLASGMRQYADGVDQFAAQTPELVDGVGQLADGADQLLGGLPQFADGAAQAIGGVAQLRDGLDQVVAGLDQPQDFSQLQELADGAAGVAAGAEGVSGGIGQVQATFDGLAAPTAPVPGEVMSQLASLAPECSADETTCSLLLETYLAGAAGGFKAGMGTASAALNTPDPTTGLSLVQGAEALAVGAGQLSDGVDQLVTELPAQTEAQLGTLKAGLTQLRDGADTLATEAQPIVDNAPAISSGATQLNAGIQQLDEEIGALPAGVAQLSDGADQLGDGASELATGAGQLSNGVGQLETGAATFAAGVTQYTEGVASASDGTAQLADGLAQLADGAAQLDDGVDTFATELAKGAEQVPSYSAADRERLATVVASPVDRADDLVQSSRVPAVTLLLVSALWLGALGAWVVARPVPRDVVSSRAPSVVLWARTMWLPLAVVAAQGVVLGLVGGVVLEAGFVTTLALAALLTVMGASFVFANHALAGWFGHAGRAISVLLLVVTVALGLSSAVSWLAPVTFVSPLHNGLLLVRAWLGGGSGEIGLAATAVLMAVVALGASVLAVSARRRLTAEQFRRRTAAVSTVGG